MGIIREEKRKAVDLGTYPIIHVYPYVKYPIIHGGNEHVSHIFYK